MNEARYPYVHVELDAGADEEEVELASMLLWEAGASGVEERDASTMNASQQVTLVASFESEEEASAAASALGERWGARVEHVVGDAWREKWKEFFRPTRVGARLVVRPSWETHEARPGDVVVTLDPGQAFGTGTHETTRLVLAEVEARVRGGESVLDVGCGSGILGITALLLGAARVAAVDVDPIAVRVTLENAEVNGVTLDASARPIEEVDGRFDLVLANIRCPTLVPMAPALAARTAGALVLSGLLVEEEATIRAAYDPLLEYEGRRVDGAWLAMVYRVP